MHKFLLRFCLPYWVGWVQKTKKNGYIFTSYYTVKWILYVRCVCFVLDLQSDWDFPLESLSTVDIAFME